MQRMVRKLKRNQTRCLLRAQSPNHWLQVWYVSILLSFFPGYGSFLGLSDVSWRESLKQKWHQQYITGSDDKSCHDFASQPIAKEDSLPPSHAAAPPARSSIDSSWHRVCCIIPRRGGVRNVTWPKPHGKVRCLFSRLRNGPSNTDLVTKNTLDSISHGYSQIVNTSSSLIHV